MDITKVIILAFVSTALILTLTQTNKEIGLYIRITCGVLIFFIIISKLQGVMTLFTELINKTTISDVYIKIIFKVIAISYLTEFSSEICKDAGESGIASNLQLSGKVLIMFMASPILLALMREITQMIG